MNETLIARQRYCQASQYEKLYPENAVAQIQTYLFLLRGSITIGQPMAIGLCNW